MKKILSVKTGNYNISISNNDFSKLMEEITQFTLNQKKLIIISKKVYKIYKNILNFYDFHILVLPDGEKQKNLKNYKKIMEKAFEIGLTRHDTIIALGGGVIGDLAGFAASTYMRGIDFIQIPTTLLSMVDSSVGGKTAIDFCEIKNCIGTFYQPKAVFININFLHTLDKKQFLSGLGEILKYSFIEGNCNYKDPLFLFEYLNLCSEKLLSKDSITIMRVIELCLKLKISVVEQDEKEAGLRKILNLGHTLGHALETLGKFKKYTHGEAVVLGIFFILNYAYKQKIITESYYKQSIELLSKYGYKPLIIKGLYTIDEIIEVMKKDKKAITNKITFITPTEKRKVKEITLSPQEVIEMF